MNLDKEQLKRIRNQIGLSQSDFILELNAYHGIEVVKRSDSVPYQNLAHIEKGKVDLNEKLQRFISEFLIEKYKAHYDYVMNNTANPKENRVVPLPDNRDFIKKVEVCLNLNIPSHIVAKYEREGKLKRVESLKRVYFTRESVESLRNELRTPQA